VADTRCPNCDHIFGLDEITEGWCAECGKKIPEVLLKDVRPKPHIRNPHPHPLPTPTQAEQAAQSRDNKLRAMGLLLMVVALLLGLVAFGWGAYNRLNGASIGIAAWVGGGSSLAVLLLGAGMLALGRGSEE